MQQNQVLGQCDDTLNENGCFEIFIRKNKCMYILKIVLSNRKAIIAYICMWNAANALAEY